MQCSIGFLLNLSGLGYGETRDVSSRLCRIEFRRFEVFGLKSFAGSSIPILTQVTLLHEALRVQKLLQVICGGKDIAEVRVRIPVYA